MISNNNIKKHSKSCSGYDKIVEIDENWKTTEGKYKCPLCYKDFSKYGISTHIKVSHFGMNHMTTGKNSWNKGLTKETDDRVKAQANTLKDGYKNGRLLPTCKGHSQETKDKISKARLKYLEENPDKVPYLLNHYSKGESYPEKYFREIFEIRGIDFEQEVQVGRYSLDFVINGVDIEIDGEQHYLDKRIVESDKQRNEYIISKGYKIKRVRWSDFQKLIKEEKISFVDNLLNMGNPDRLDD